MEAGEKALHTTIQPKPIIFSYNKQTNKIKRQQTTPSLEECPKQLTAPKRYGNMPWGGEAQQRQVWSQSEERNCSLTIPREDQGLVELLNS